MNHAKPNPLTDSELDYRYAEFLNNCYGPVNICGYEYDAASALKEVDPTAYRCGFSDWLDAELDETLVEVAGKYFDKNEYEAFAEESKNETH